MALIVIILAHVDVESSILMAMGEPLGTGT